MKKVCSILLILALLPCACRPAEVEKSSTPAQSSSVVQPVILKSWVNEDWQQTGGTIFSYDLNGDGQQEEVSYQLNDEKWEALFKVEMQTYTLDYGVLESAVLADFDPQDDVYELFFCGDTGSSDFETAQLRYDGKSLQEVQAIYGYLHLESEEFWMGEVIDALGTWMGQRQYGPDAQGVLVPLSDTLILNQDAEAESADRVEFYPRVIQDLSVTVDGKEGMIPAGSCVYPVCYADDLSWVELKVVGGGRARLLLQLKEYDGVRSPDYEWEGQYFENLRYAG